jgi:ligand-binding SRPBCC domain-containing protein
MQHFARRALRPSLLLFSDCPSSIEQNMLHRFTTSQWVPYDIESVFSFFANPNNLPALMPPRQKVRIEYLNIVPPPGQRISPGPRRMFPSVIAGNDSTIVMSFRPFPLSPVRQRWHSVIESFAWNDQFCDVQESGPFAYWKHCHYVREETRDQIGGTLITDDVVYEMKLGRFGDLAHGLFFTGRMQKLFSYRKTQVLKLLEPARTPPRPYLATNRGNAPRVR